MYEDKKSGELSFLNVVKMKKIKGTDFLNHVINKMQLTYFF